MIYSNDACRPFLRSRFYQSQKPAITLTLYKAHYGGFENSDQFLIGSSYTHHKQSAVRRLFVLAVDWHLLRGLAFYKRLKDEVMQSECEAVLGRMR
jgi:hypothetical protein